MFTMAEICRVVLLLLITNLTIASKYRVCNLHKLECPQNSLCSQIGNDNGECICTDDFELNSHSTDANDYCVKDENGIGDGYAMNGGREKPVVHVQYPPESHHILLGILIPLLLVLFIIAAAYGIKKFHPVRRLREYVISRRRNRPLYEDVMMTQELDDPPLI